jgi:hypothetical protein
VKDEFLSTLSHELRTPLTAIVGWTYLLRGGRLDDATAARGLEAIERNAAAQAQVISDILDLSRMVGAKFRLNVRPLQLAPVAAAALEPLMPAATAKAIKVQTLLDPAAGLVVGDPDRLRQVVWNLAANAVKFTPRGGRVTVRVERLPHADVRLVVEDTGEGISADFLPHVFERFRQGDASNTRSHGGLGLGLAGRAPSRGAARRHDRSAQRRRGARRHLHGGPARRRSRAASARGARARRGCRPVDVPPGGRARPLRRARARRGRRRRRARGRERRARPVWSGGAGGRHRERGPWKRWRASRPTSS